MPFYPGNSFTDGIWDVPFYLAICAELSETYRSYLAPNRGAVRGTAVSDTTGLRIMGFPPFWGGVLDKSLSVLVVWNAKTNDRYDRGFDVMILRTYIWPRGVCDNKVQPTRVCSSMVCDKTVYYLRSSCVSL